MYIGLNSTTFYNQETINFLLSFSEIKKPNMIGSLILT